ncbi:MAG: tetratricopeptide repeat protein [Phycisphaeraceae bacterium]|nr:tetratricopeptide repeat protein [Phycisphaeraceae bacterium]
MTDLSVITPGTSLKLHRLGWLLMLAVVAVVYGGALDAGFYLDDENAILLNNNVIHLGQAIKHAMVSDRGLVTLSFAFNYALGGENPWGYHLVNVLIHWLNGMLLYGLLRRTLLLDRVGFSSRAACYLAMACALLWLVHPLGSQAVVYAVQRAELMAAGCYLACVYALVCSSQSKLYPRRWLGACVFFCLIGMQCKLIVFTAPLAVLAYDRLFLSESYQQIWQKHRWLFAGLFATWVMVWVTGMTNLFSAEVTNASAGANMATIISPITYLAAQSGVILYYLKISLWPAVLLFDHAWPVPVSPGEYALWFVILTTACLSTVGLYFWGVRWSWLAVCFFLILAPTSSIAPVADLAVEHRMYLPLVCVCVGVVLLLWRLLGKRSGLLAVVLCVMLVLLSVRTMVRVADYRDAESLWQSVLKHLPNSKRAKLQLAVAQALRQGLAQEITQLRQALVVNPNEPAALYRLAEIYFPLQKYDQAMGLFEKAHELEPLNVQYLMGLAKMHRFEGHLDQALGEYQQVLKLKPDQVTAMLALAELFASQKQWDQALVLLDKATLLRPQDTSLLSNRVNILLRAKRPLEALAPALQAYKQSPQSLSAASTLASTYAATGQWQRARELFEAILQKTPNDARTLQRLAWLYATCPDSAQRNSELAKTYARAFFDLTGGINPMSWDTLGAAYAQTGEFDRAVDAMHKAILRLNRVGRSDMVPSYQQRLDLYLQQKPYRQLNVVTPAVESTH